MPVQEKVAQVAFAQETGLSPEQIREAGLRSLEAGRRFMNTTITESAVDASSIRYLAKGPGGFVKQMAMLVRWTETGNGRRTVHFSIGDYLTMQSKFLMFIPAGPKRIPALPSAQRFAEALRAELALA
jgi:hypothetical protein